MADPLVKENAQLEEGDDAQSASENVTSLAATIVASPRPGLLRLTIVGIGLLVFASASLTSLPSLGSFEVLGLSAVAVASVLQLSVLYATSSSSFVLAATGKLLSRSLLVVLATLGLVSIYAWVFAPVERSALLMSPHDLSMVRVIGLLGLSVSVLSLAEFLFSRVGTFVHPLNSLFQRASDAPLLVAGDIVPADGVIQRGEVLVKVRRFSPRPCLRSIGVGETLYAGSEVISGRARWDRISETSESDFSLLLDSFAAASAPKYRLEIVGANLFLWACVFMNGLTQGWSVPDFLLVTTFLSAGVVSLRLLLLAHRLPRSIREHIFLSGVLLPSEEELRTTAGRSIVNVLVDAPEQLLHRELRSLELFDDSLEEQQVRVLIAKCLASMKEDYEAVIDALLENVEEPVDFGAPVRLSPASAEGIELRVGEHVFFFGSEMFMLEKGVFLELSETSAAGESQVSLDEPLYLAIAGKALASLTVERVVSSSEKTAIDAARRDGLTPRLIVLADDAESVDNLGAKAGFELAEIRRADSDSNLSPGLLTASLPGAAVEGELPAFDVHRWNLGKDSPVHFLSSLGGMLSVLVGLRVALRQRRTISILSAIALSCFVSVAFFPFSGVASFLWTFGLAVSGAGVIILRRCSSRLQNLSGLST